MCTQGPARLVFAHGFVSLKCLHDLAQISHRLSQEISRISANVWCVCDFATKTCVLIYCSGASFNNIFGIALHTCSVTRDNVKTMFIDENGYVIS